MGLLTRLRQWKATHDLHTVITVEPVLFLYMLSTFLKFPSFQALAMYKVCLQEYNDTVLCEDFFNHTDEKDYIEKEASHWLLYCNIAFTTPSVLAVIFMGSWIDKAQSRIVLVLPTVGQVVEGTLLLLNSVYIHLPLVAFIPGSLAAGMFGGFATLLMVCFSYITVIAQGEKERTIRVAILESMTFIAGGLGSGLSGLLKDRFGFVTVFAVSLVISVVLLVYIVVWIKEPQSHITRTEITCGLLCNHRHFVDTVKCAMKERPGKRRCIIWLCLAIFIMSLVVFGGAEDVTYLYFKYVIKDWTTALYGGFLAFKFTMYGISLLVILPLLKKFGSLRDATLGVLGLLGACAGSVILIFTTTVMMAFTAPLFLGMKGLSAAPIRAIISKMVEVEEQGKIFAIVAVVEVVGVLMASVIYNSLWPATLEFFPGFVFALSLGILTFSLILMLIIRHLVSKEVESGLAYGVFNDEDKGEDGTETNIIDPALA
ncbi:proton-coupled folate transporter [Lingula anatina]|uniref:Proton-coupled folate transporter n=1 Tax=Lingula anatina TaxID=7574 RepID=A0A1S3IHI9_LINAN|nr:proton-coupled folate transporter [Lingula anatina]XP_013396940.1 proton-coupled folate transporter [Lingula anatina]XP_013396949.1 proton-coupled folate transporter [Lingula anatina]XP_013396954.1 proton-coupled folate transporter [Lingula anatina]|eukprot:XP_013396933.1 proton-coupled folate transporter [Lingula anatina]